MCFRCKEAKDASEFHRNVRIPDGLSVYCKLCIQQGKRAHYYGVSAEQYNALLAAQGGRCAVCRLDATSLRYPLSVDHDHNCCAGRKSCGKCLRGLLCHVCNRALGLMRDSADRLRCAADYLDGYPPAANAA